MKIYNIFEDNIPNISPYIALGNFDGLHIAHRQLIKSTAGHGHAAAVFTFEKLRAPSLITESERLRLFEALSLDALFVCDFDSVKDLSPTEFFDDILVKRLHIAGAFCGFNFTFGKGASGSSETLNSLCKARGIYFSQLDKLSLDSKTVSSTAIKALLASGQPEDAAKMLGRPFSFESTVVHGKRLGRVLGFPTINTPLPSTLTKLKNGVYFTKCKIDGTVFNALTNYGIRPTFSDTEVIAESYLLDSKGDFYGKNVSLEFLAFHRSEMKFSDQNALSIAVHNDIESAKSYFSLK